MSDSAINVAKARSYLERAVTAIDTGYSADAVPLAAIATGYATLATAEVIAAPPEPFRIELPREVDATELAAFARNFQARVEARPHDVDVRSARLALQHAAELAETAGKQRTAAWLRECADAAIATGGPNWPDAPAYKGPVAHAGDMVTVDAEGVGVSVCQLEHTVEGGWRVAIPIERIP